MKQQENDPWIHGQQFPPTRWSVIEAARKPAAGERERALDTLCGAYWSQSMLVEWFKVREEISVSQNAMHPKTTGTSPGIPPSDL